MKDAHCPVRPQMPAAFWRCLHQTQTRGQREILSDKHELVQKDSVALLQLNHKVYKGRILCFKFWVFKAQKIKKDLDSQHHGSLWSLFSTFGSSFSFPFLASQTPSDHLTSSFSSSTITMAASFISLSLSETYFCDGA